MLRLPTKRSTPLETPTPARACIPFVVDEDLSAEICAVLTGAGHRVVYIAAAFPGLKDPEVAQHADAMGAIVVTHNHKDYIGLITRTRPPRKHDLKHAGRLSITSLIATAAHVAAALPLIELEFMRRGVLSDKRVIAEVTTEHLRFEL